VPRQQADGRPTTSDHQNRFGAGLSSEQSRPSHRSACAQNMVTEIVQSRGREDMRELKEGVSAYAR